MLAKKIIILLTSSLTITSNSCSQAAGLINQKNKLMHVMISDFCKKYQCKISDQQDSNSNLYTYHVTLKGNKYSGPNLDQPETIFGIQLKNDKILYAVMQLGADYPENKLAPEFAEIANDFINFVAGKKIISSEEVNSGGKISLCFHTINDAFISNGRNYSNNSTIIKFSNYSIKCKSLISSAEKKSSRTIEITLISVK